MGIDDIENSKVVEDRYFVSFLQRLLHLDHQTVDVDYSSGWQKYSVFLLTILRSRMIKVCMTYH